METTNLRHARVREIWQRNQTRGIYTLRERGSFTCEDRLADDLIDYTADWRTAPDFKTVTFYAKGCRSSLNGFTLHIVSDEGFIVGYM